MVQITFEFRPAQNVRPPVYIAGSFSDPSWVPQSMDYYEQHVAGSSELSCVFEKKIDVKPGQYQYKYRIGEDNEWVVDRSVCTGRVFWLHVYGISLTNSSYGYRRQRKQSSPG
jgi:hypothetical protein